MEPIPHSRPWITESERAAVEAALASEMIGQGERTRRLESEMSAWVGSRDGVAAGSGTAALALALHGVGVRGGDEVVLPTYVCRSVMEAVHSVGARPVLCDIGADWMLKPEAVEGCVTPATRAIVVPHLYGIFADVAAFRRFDCAIIEDFAQAVAGRGDRALVGDVGVFSLHPTKCLTAGEGGVAVSSDPDLVQKMRAYRDGREAAEAGRLLSPLSDLAAALALAQLARYADGLERRRRIAGAYLDALDPVLPPGALNRPAFERSMFFRFPVRVPSGVPAFGDAFLRAGVIVRRGVDELLHRLGAMADERFPVAVELYQSTISLPIYPALGEDEIRTCARTAARLLGEAAAVPRERAGVA